MPQHLRYAGYWYDTKLSWYWISVRSYDPEGRWLQPDPSGVDGVRTYVYAGDDPVDTSDPSGLVACFGQHGLVILGHVIFPPCPNTANESALLDAAYQIFIGDDLDTIASNANIGLKALAAADVVLILLPIEKVAKVAVIGAKAVRGVVKSVATARRISRAYVSLSVAERAAHFLRDARIVHLAKQLRFTATTVQHQQEVSRRVPLYLLSEAILYGRRVPDPQAAPGAVKIIMDDFSFDVYVPGRPSTVARAGKVLTIIYREADKTILHYDYYSR